ncbi:hypothetical protein [Mycobacterium triplex]|uniref:Uncharacterized protein n=1 Tax=Mycobacterium triplex TaxID=47839 RepID=A0A024K0Z8_9MYCO|nr:hypothetical protein [Mycobacterium triplex]CDO89242.1 hypothetical protein BN973_03615 [Mycobacterium triplex]
MLSRADDDVADCAGEILVQRGIDIVTQLTYPHPSMPDGFDSLLAAL